MTERNMETIRSFVSFEIPEMPAIRETQQKLRAVRGVSVPDSVHLTLRFLGDVEAKRIKELSARMMSLEKYQPFTVSMKGLGAFPNVRDPRVVWIGAELGDQFQSILCDLDKMLDASSIDYDKKPFKAHVTLGRVKMPSTILTDLLNKERDRDIGSFTCSEIFLMSSMLTPKGAIHSAINTFDLKGDQTIQ
ncbi:MAG: RNA 2',3'-cyclic phosphodiesterase [Methanomassiliicoccaceae archaeon]|nr:RNA 2',3'-cyclic phosphodiesterase [Methanomassiliicoccaceae archaeon]